MTKQWLFATVVFVWPRCSNILLVFADTLKRIGGLPTRRTPEVLLWNYEGVDCKLQLKELLWRRVCVLEGVCWRSFGSCGLKKGEWAESTYNCRLLYLLLAFLPNYAVAFRRATLLARFYNCGLVEMGLRRTIGGSNTHPHAAPKVGACASSIRPSILRLSTRRRSSDRGVHFFGAAFQKSSWFFPVC